MTKRKAKLRKKDLIAAIEKDNELYTLIFAMALEHYLKPKAKAKRRKAKR